MSHRHHTHGKHHSAAQARRRATTATEATQYQRPLVDPEVKYAGHPRFYIGYGSNHNVIQMQARCPRALPRAAGMMPNTRLVFAGVLTVEHVDGEECPVSIWEVTATDIAALDRYEGYPHNYGKRYTHVEVDGVRQEAFYYVMNNYSEAPPGDWYYQVCAEGYEDFHLPISYLEAARDRARAHARDHYGVTLFDADDDWYEWLDIGDPQVSEDDLRNWREQQAENKRMANRTQEGIQ